MSATSGTALKRVCEKLPLLLDSASNPPGDVVVTPPKFVVVMPLIDTGKPVLYAVAIVGMCAVGGIGSGPTGAFIPELFATRYRYSGSAFAINFAGVFGGALPPLLAGTLQATYGGWAVGPMLALLATASFVCTFLLPETKGTALHSAGEVAEVSAG